MTKSNNNTKAALRVAFGVDHGGWELRQTVLDLLAQLGHSVTDCGAYSLDPQDDYPQFATAAARLVAEGSVDRAILICGSGVGVTVTANKLPGVRACLCHDTFSAAQGVRDDDMNVLCLGARVIGAELAKLIVKAFLAERFAADVERYQRRLRKVVQLEENWKR